MAIDVNLLERAYFYFDKPVQYKIDNEYTVDILPISLLDYEVFTSSVDVLQIDKNSLNSVEIIQMSYLDFLFKILLVTDESNLLLDKMINLMRLCLGWTKWVPKIDEKKKSSLFNTETGCVINGKQFEDIRRIILYQNILSYDDSYIDPDLKKSMAEMDRLKALNIEAPSLERKIAIITAHCGLSKSEQLKMTIRSHQLLFNECCGEVEFSTTRPIALYAGKAKEIDHWIYKRKKDKFDGYITSVESYNKSMGGDGSVKSASSDTISQVNNISK